MEFGAADGEERRQVELQLEALPSRAQRPVHRHGGQEDEPERDPQLRRPRRAENRRQGR